MSLTAQRLLSEIRTLPPEDLREVCQEVIQLAAHLDYGDISDDALTALAAETFALLDKEEADAGSR
jgi:hypothetical protein